MDFALIEEEIGVRSFIAIYAANKDLPPTLSAV